MSVVPNAGEDMILTVKLLLLGESSVGKSSIVNRYTNHSF
jgi:GTPase SAR1 family protein